MSSIKFKYTLEEANEKLKELAPIVTPLMKSEYHMLTNTSAVTQWKWLKGLVPSVVAANHFIEFIETYLKRNNAA